MKRLIKINESCYIICDDSEIKEGEWFYNQSTNYIGQTLRKEGNFWVCNNMEGFHLLSEAKKITHSTQPIETTLGMKAFIVGGIKELSLSEVEEAINGYSVEKIKKEYNQGNNQDVFTKGIEQGIEIGFKAHQELVKDKLFTIEDIKTFYKCVKTHTFDEAMSLIFPKTEWGIEIDEQGKLKLI